MVFGLRWRCVERLCRGQRWQAPPHWTSKPHRRLQSCHRRNLSLLAVAVARCQSNWAGVFSRWPTRDAAWTPLRDLSTVIRIKPLKLLRFHGRVGRWAYWVSTIASSAAIVGAFGICHLVGKVVAISSPLGYSSCPAPSGCTASSAGKIGVSWFLDRLHLRPVHRRSLVHDRTGAPARDCWRQLIRGAAADRWLELGVLEAGPPRNGGSRFLAAPSTNRGITKPAVGSRIDAGVTDGFLRSGDPPLVIMFARSGYRSTQSR